MAYSRNRRTGTITFDASAQTTVDLTEKLNIESISYQGGAGAFEIGNGDGDFLDSATTSASQTDVTHYFFGKEVTGLTATTIPASGKIVVQLMKNRR